jgi:ParB family chromosome partitioning protein
VSKERRLGRGLEALLGRSYAESARPELTLHAPDSDADAAAGATQPGAAPAAGDPSAGAQSVDVRQIQTNPFQPRQDFDEQELASLADSLREHGLLQPLLVRRAAAGFQLIAGERRLRAAVQAGWTQVPVLIRDADDRQMSELAIVENLQRKDLNALEKAASFEQYLDRYSCTQEELASRLNIDRSTIANLIRLLELPAVVQDAVRSGQITQGHARALLPLGDEREQISFCLRIQAEGLSVRATEQTVQDVIHAADTGPLSVVEGAPKSAAGKARSRNQNLTALEQEFRAALGTKVGIRQSAKGRGKIVIQFSSREEFERLRSHLTGQGDVAARAG